MGKLSNSYYLTLELWENYQIKFLLFNPKMMEKISIPNYLTLE